MLVFILLKLYFLDYNASKCVVFFLQMASLAATNWPKPISLVPCLSWSSASPVFTEGVMSASINWSLLETQYFSNEIYQNDLAKMVKIIDHNVNI